MKAKKVKMDEHEFRLNVSRLRNLVVPAVLMILIRIFSIVPLNGQGSQSPSQTVCIGTEPYLVTATSGSAYGWTITPGTSGSEWQIHGTGSSVSVDWKSAGTYTLSVIETNSYGCSGSPVSVEVTVAPVPDVIQPANINVNNGAAVNPVSFSGSVAGTVYSWTNDSPSIGLAAGGTGNTVSFTAVNPGTTPVIATITVTPVYSASGITCTGTPGTFTITVNPSTTVDPVADVVYCSGATAAGIVFTSPVAGTTFSWTSSNTTIGLAGSGTGNIPSFTTVNTGTVPVISTITVVPYSGGQPGNPISFTVTVNPLPSTSPIFHN